jgi:hypothetical protein
VEAPAVTLARSLGEHRAHNLWQQGGCLGGRHEAAVRAEAAGRLSCALERTDGSSREGPKVDTRSKVAVTCVKSLRLGLHGGYPWISPEYLAHKKLPPP